MKPHHSRKLLIDVDTTLLSPPYHVSASDPPLHNARPNTSPLDFSMALTAIVLFTALFFMGFFSLYLRCFADSPSSSSSRRRRRPSSPFSSSSYSLPLWRPSNHPRPKGLDPSFVRLLPLVSYNSDAKKQTNYECDVHCVICLCEFEEGEVVKMIPYCRHVFHPGCVDTWLALHVSCPLCRSSRIFGEAGLGVSRGEGERLGGSTVEIEDVVGPVGVMRRACSYPSVGDRVVLERSLSI